MRVCDVALKTLTRLDGGSVYQLKNEFAEEPLWSFTIDLVDGGLRPLGEPEPTGFDEPRLRGALAPLLDGLEAIHDAGKLWRVRAYGIRCATSFPSDVSKNQSSPSRSKKRCAAFGKSVGPITRYLLRS